MNRTGSGAAAGTSISNMKKAEAGTVRGELRGQDSETHETKPEMNPGVGITNEVNFGVGVTGGHRPTKSSKSRRI